MTVNRRHFLGFSSLAVLQGCATSKSSLNHNSSSAVVDYQWHAIAAANFIESQKVITEAGHTWYKSPDEPIFLTDLYHGAAGVVLFQLEMYRMTGKLAYLNNARFGADDLLTKIPKVPKAWQHGLYTGSAAFGFVLSELYQTTSDKKYYDAMVLMIKHIEDELRVEKSGARFSALTDIIYGYAGIILFLLEVSQVHQQEAWKQLAIGLGDELMKLARTTKHGKRWFMRPFDLQEMPNFSHGTAGVAYALSRLYEDTQEQRFLTAAIAGANHLLSIAKNEHDQCQVAHKLPEASERYYMAYCHGPVGTSRLFYQLALVDQSQPWSEHFDRLNQALRNSGMPRHQSAGFWDNVGQCCGSAAVAEHYISLYQLSQKIEFLNSAIQMTEDIVKRATSDGQNQQWVHAENRIEPYWQQSQTGYMQGAAGIGSLFVRLASIESGAKWKSRFLDNLFG